jgi:hypothetical protein
LLYSSRCEIKAIERGRRLLLLSSSVREEKGREVGVFYKPVERNNEQM